MNGVIVSVAIGFSGLILFGLMGLLAWRQRSASRNNKLPFTKRYLRPPGESLRIKLEKLDDKTSDLATQLVGAGFLFGCAVYVFLTGSPWIGAFVIAAALAAMLVVAVGFERHVCVRRRHYIGFLGERAIGEELNQLLANGWAVFHDVPFDDNPGARPFNVDHVVVGPGGLFAIETKTRRKRKESGGHEVTFNGQNLTYPWGTEEWGIKAALERANYLSRWLSESLKADIKAAPVLVLPGWFVHRVGRSELTVISDGEISTLFRNEHNAARLKPDTMSAIRALLEQKCRDVGA